MTAVDRDARWQVDGADYPAGGSTADRLRFALRYAILAPSSHNSQPWRYFVDGSAVELYADRDRRLSVVDPDDRELVMSCGAALFTLRLALNHFGEDVDVDVAILPEGPDSALLARIELRGRPYRTGPQERDMFAAIARRHTSRVVFDETPVSEQIILALRDAAFRERAWFFDIPAIHYFWVAGLVADADTVQMSNPEFRHELAHWMRTSHSSSGDGMPGYAFGFSELQSVVGPLVVRTFDVGSSTAAKDQELAEGSPVLAILCTPYDDVPNWLAAGQALQRVLLTATAAGLQASFLNQPIEIPDMRNRLATELRISGRPQQLLRFGFGPAGRPTPRRPVEDVLLSARPAR